MIYNKSILIGYELNHVIKNIEDTKDLVIQTTKTPLNSKIEERINNEPVIIKHVEDDDRIVLTVSYFK